ncbi:MAG: Fe-S cluster assembly protein SufD [Flavobacteriaceae bacterium]|tara:strand:+ start:820 stop:2136 length:1317 start_codon:yes stop_codon:yes gene_type:complete
MELKEKLISSFMAFEEKLDLNTDVHNIRSKSFDYFEKNGFPTKKNEAWKYTSLEKLLKNDYRIFPKKDISIELKDVKKYFLYDLDTYKIVFIDGIYSPFLSDTTHDGLDVCLLSAALNKPKYKKVIKKYFNKIVNKNDSLTSLNTSFTKEGAYIFIPKTVISEKPIQIIHFSTGKQGKMLLQPRNLIIVEENAQVQIIERHQSLKSFQILTNSVTEIFSNKGSSVDYYKIQNDYEDCSLIDNTYISQDSDSNVKVHTFSLGGKLIRNNLNFFQNGENIQSTMKGITIIGDRQHVDHYTLVHHSKPNCNSFQEYKGIFSDRAVGVFNGKILVDKIAQKTNAFQQNNNILIDDNATINSKPQLEIFADDVKCSHGCTIGQLDNSALFYLRSRGIPLKEAKALLTYAFANNVLESVQIPELKNRINSLIAKKIGVNLGHDL